MADNDRKKWMPINIWEAWPNGLETADDDTNLMGDYNHPGFIMRSRYIIDGVQTTKPDFDILRLELAESVSENIDLQNYTRE